MKKSSKIAPVATAKKRSTRKFVTAEQAKALFSLPQATIDARKAKRNEAAKAKRAYTKTVVNLGSIVAGESFAEANSIENIEVAEPIAYVATAEQILEAAEKTGTEISSVEFAKGSPEWATAEARIFLGETAIVWIATENAKGVAYATPRYRVGLPAATDTGYLIEAGRKIVGAGNSYTEAVKDARTRTAAKAA
jgi:hypothetical protein